MEEKRLNLLFVMADQFRYDGLGANGNPIVQTPCLDAFARESVNVSRYYVNCPVCVPSRTTLFTGRYPHSHRIRENHTLMEPNAEMHLFRILKQEGYQIGYVGKNHLLNNEEFSNFDYTDIEWNPLSGGKELPFYHKYTPQELAYVRFAQSRSKQMEANGAFAGAAGHTFPESCTEPQVFTDAAIHFLETRTPDAPPFCLCLSWVPPHAPHIAPDFIRDLYKDADISVLDTDVAALQAKANRYFVKYRAQKSDLATREDKINFIATYYAMITALDRQFGRLMETLHKLGMEEDTVVVFTSDHGEFLFENGMCKKDLVMADLLLHVPLLIRCPNRLTPRVVDTQDMMESVDVMPTLLELLGVQLPLGVQGKSALAYLQGHTDNHKSAVYGEVCTPWQFNPYDTFDDMEQDWMTRFNRHAILNVPGDFTKSVRTAKFRYVWYASGEEELYALTDDPQECKNVASMPEYHEALIEHKLLLLEWLALSEDPLDPLIGDMNQKRYDRWIGAKPIRKGLGGPYWLEQVK